MDDFILGFKTRRSITQLFRYTIIGLVSNILGYMIYLLLTYLGATPKITMTVLYIVGAAIGFYGNHKLTFEYNGSLLGAGGRYIIAHCIGYFINLVILIILVDMYKYSHQWVQAIAILFVASFLFLSFKLFVFRPSKILGVR